MTAQAATPSSRQFIIRRQYYIQRSFQRRFVLQFCALVIAGCALCAVLVCLYASRTLTTVFFQSKLRVLSTADFLWPVLGASTVIAVLLVGGIAVIRLLRISHKIAGPLYRFEQTAKAISAGDLRMQIRLRHKDELQEFSRSFNEMVGGLRDRVQSIKGPTKRLQHLLSDMHRLPTLPPELLRALQETQSELEDAVNRFRV